MLKSKLDVLAQMLEMAEIGTTKNKIAFQMDLHHELVDKSLNLLTNLDLLKETRNSPISFVITQKGLQFLHDYLNLKKEMAVEEP